MERRLFVKMTPPRSSVKDSNIKTPLEKLLLVTTTNEVRAYISGNQHGIFVIDRLGNLVHSYNTTGSPSGLAIMADGSLIYSVYEHNAVYRVSPTDSTGNQATKLIDTVFEPGGICCSRSGDILVRLGYSANPIVFRYGSDGKKVQEYQMPEEDKEREIWGQFYESIYVCENVNGDVCTVYAVVIRHYKTVRKVIVFKSSGSLHFQYDGSATQRFESFTPVGLTTDSLGNILISDSDNHAVHLISQDGDFIAYILTKDDEISCPWGITVDASDSLWLVERDNSRVKVFQYLTTNWP
jgi:sugar lactone lactonase YvrE